MSTVRRDAVAALDRIESDAKALRRLVEAGMNDNLNTVTVAGYLDRARWLRDHLNHLDKQLSHLKDIVK